MWSDIEENSLENRVSIKCKTESNKFHDIRVTLRGRVVVQFETLGLFLNNYRVEFLRVFILNKMS